MKKNLAPVKKKSATKAVATKSIAKKPAAKKVSQPKPAAKSATTSAFLDSLKTRSNALEVTTIEIDQIEADPHNPRDTFRLVEHGREPETELSLEELADSIAEQGLIQPVVVVELPSGSYRLVAGERRWRAFQLLAEREGLQGRRGIKANGFDPRFIPAIISSGASQRKVRISQLHENIQREDLSELQLAKQLQFMFEEDPKLKKEDICSILKKPKSYIYRIMRLLDPRYADLINEGIVTYASLLERLAAAPEPKQREIVERARSEGRSINSGDFRREESKSEMGNRGDVADEELTRAANALGNPDGEADGVRAASIASKAASSEGKDRYNDSGEDVIPTTLGIDQPLSLGDSVSVDLTRAQLAAVEKAQGELEADTPVRIVMTLDRMMQAIAKMGGEVDSNARRGDITLKFFALLGRYGKRKS